VSLSSAIVCATSMLRTGSLREGQHKEVRGSIIVVLTCGATVDRNPSSPNGVPLEGAIISAATDWGGREGAGLHFCLPEANPSDALAAVVGSRGVMHWMDPPRPKGGGPTR